MASVQEHSAEIGGQPLAWLTATDPAAAAGRAPVLYVHGVPANAELWIPFLQRTGGIALDLPGFGRSGKRHDLAYTVPGFATAIEDLLAHLDVSRVRLVCHDWGAGAALGWAQRHPEAIERLVIMDGVPLLAGYRWHRIARLWRRRLVGELVQGALSRGAFARLSTMDEATLDLVWRRWDQGTQRAVLRLYRWADPDVLEACGARLGDIDAETLVLWGAQDPYIPPRFAQAYADALGGPCTVEVLDVAGHWPWIERPEVIDRVASFLAAPSRAG